MSSIRHAIAAINSFGSAFASVADRASERSIGPRPVSSQSAFTEYALTSADRNSTLGACPDMYRRTVSGL